MYKQLAVAVCSIALLGGLAPSAQATPAIEGSTKVSAGPFTPCLATCAPFFESDCSTDLARRDGVTTSIVDISRFAGQHLRFTWSDLSARLHDDLGSHVKPTARVFFYIVDRCTTPSWFSFVLTSSPGERSRDWTIPQGSRWLIVESADVSGGMTWSAK